MEYDSGSDLLKLAELLKPPEINHENHQNPGCNSKNRNQNNGKSPYERFPEKVPKTMEEFVEQQRQEAEFVMSERRKQPVYDIKYRQAVTSEDIFLQMGMKTPSTSSCEDMVLTINLPDETFSALDLNVTDKSVEVNGFVYSLKLDLPHPINPKYSNAKWDQEKETLVLTMRMVREFDFVNF